MIMAIMSQFEQIMMAIMSQFEHNIMAQFVVALKIRRKPVLSCKTTLSDLTLACCSYIRREMAPAFYVAFSTYTKGYH